jgi:hypothetical protein
MVLKIPKYRTQFVAQLNSDKIGAFIPSLHEILPKTLLPHPINLYQ